MQQLVKNQEIHPSAVVEALLRCGISREKPPSLLSLESVLDTFEATQEVPRHTNLHSRGTPRVPPKLKKSPGFPSSSREEDLFPCFVGKRMPVFLSHFNRLHLSLTLERNSSGRATNSKTLMSQCTADTPDSPVTYSTITPRTNSKHVDGCYSPVAIRQKPTGPYVNPTGSLTLLCLLERRVDVHI